MKPVLSAYRRILVACAFLATLAACGMSPLSPQERLDNLKEEGWREFAAENYSTAESRFRAAAEIFASDPGAQLGLGWADLEQSKLTDAANALVRITDASDTNYVHAQAGLALVYDAQAHFDRSIEAARAVLTRNADYAFPYDSRVDWRDMSYLLAKNYLVLSAQADPNLAETLRYLRRIDSGPAIIPDDPATWTAAGERYDTLAEAVLKRLELLQYAVAEGTAS